MSSAAQQQNYTTGLNVTATILNSEFGNIITHLNSIYGFIDDSTGSAVLTVNTITPSVELNNNYTIEESGDGNFYFYHGGAAGTLHKIMVPTTGDLQAAIDAFSGTYGKIELLPGAHSITTEINVNPNGGFLEITGSGGAYITIDSAVTNVFEILDDNVWMSNLIIKSNVNLTATTFFKLNASGTVKNIKIDAYIESMGTSTTGSRVLDTATGTYESLEINLSGDLAKDKSASNAPVDLNNVSYSIINLMRNTSSGLPSVSLDISCAYNIVNAKRWSNGDLGTNNDINT